MARRRRRRVHMTVNKGRRVRRAKVRKTRKKRNIVSETFSNKNHNCSALYDYW